MVWEASFFSGGTPNPKLKMLWVVPNKGADGLGYVFFSLGAEKILLLLLFPKIP